MAVTLHYFTEFGNPVFQHITASICRLIYARVYCILYCVYDVVVGKTTESDRHPKPNTNPNPNPYLVAVRWRSDTVVLPLRKESSRSLSHLLMSFSSLKCSDVMMAVLEFIIAQ